MELKTEAELFAVAEKLLAKGVKHLLVSLGAHGSYYFTNEQRVKIHPLKVNVVSPVGAGDSQVAAFAYAVERHRSVNEMLRLIAAVSSAMVTTSGTDVPSLELVYSLYEKIRLEEK